MIAGFGNTPGLLLCGEPPQFQIESGYTTYKFLFNLFASANDEIAYFYSKKFGTDKYSLNQIRTMGSVILPMYQKMVESGEFPAFEFYEARHAPAPTQSIIMCKKIGELSGYNYLDVWAYLSCLESLAKSGIIDMKHYNPGLKELKTTTEFHPVQSVIDSIKDAPGAVSDFVASAAAPVNTASKRVLILAGVAVGGYALFTANKFIKRR